MTDTTISAAIPARRAVATPYIVGPIYDGLFFIFSPLLALGLGVLIFAFDLSSRKISIFGHEGSPPAILIGTFIMAHLFAVFFRSNGNPKIFALYPYRFTVVPIALFCAMCISPFVAIAVGVLATWWDVYHSSLQTFGLGRIYDRKAGNDPTLGRWLDYFLNLLLYAGPILAGASLMLHTKDFRAFKQVQAPFFASLGDRMDAGQPMVTRVILAIGVPFLLYYLASYYKLWRQGYNVSMQKVLLLTATGFCSIYTWGFNSFGEAFFIMNFFHAFQYFGLVWWSEQKNMRSLFRLERIGGGKALSLILFLGITFGYGFWAEVFDTETVGRQVDVAWNIAIVVAIMHFWYDGFIWSVQKKQI
ncbi:MAG TPA: hypothetical protein VFB67_02375 [Candidatus Polarisedimenticolaceae bacterium]|nr:hypothetical protein [Candidatus Polarisedimenticolaceae bacterium]